MPPQHFIKINSDAALKAGIYCTAVVARDHSGHLLAMKAARIQTDLPELAEAFGVLQILLLAKEQGWTKIWSATDARNVILKLQHF